MITAVKNLIIGAMFSLMVAILSMLFHYMPLAVVSLISFAVCLIAACVCAIWYNCDNKYVTPED